jgi:hypothetical protein
MEKIRIPEVSPKTSNLIMLQALFVKPVTRSVIWRKKSP